MCIGRMWIFRPVTFSLYTVGDNLFLSVTFVNID